MKQEQNIDKPLYRRLDEEREQGEFNIETNPLGTGKGFRIDVVTDKAVVAHIVPHDYNLTKGHHRYTPKNKATAKYIAFAVNNISYLAEALTELLNNPMPNNKACGYQLRMDKYFAAQEKAKAALTRIS